MNKLVENNLLELLATARRLNNETVRSSAEIESWHRKVDFVLNGTPFDKSEDRWDAPHRIENRELVKRLFFS